MSTPLFVYGTLMFPEIFQAVTGTEICAGPAILRGYARYRVVGKKYPVIVVEEEASVEGQLCLDVSAEVMARLDSYEGVTEGLYCRSEVAVETPEGVVVQALTYVSGPRLGAVGERWDPTQEDTGTYLREEVAPYLERCRRNGTIPAASSIL